MASLAVVFDLIAKDNASRSIQAVGDAAEDTGKRGTRAFEAMAVASTAIVAAVGKFAVDSVKSAADAEQAFGGVDAVFGKAAAAVEQYASTSAKRLGLAGQDYATLAATVGSQLQRMGQSQDESAKSTDKLVTLGADLAATFGGSVSDAVSAVGSLLRGERDPIERYGVGINEAAIKSRLAADGLDNLKGAALEQAKAQTTLKLLFEQTANAQGQSSRESGTLQGQTQRLSAQYKDLTSEVGTKLLPVVTGAIEKFQSVARFTDEHRKVVIPLGVAIGGLTAAVLAVNAATAASSAVTAAASSVRAFFTTTTIASTGAERASTISRAASTVATGAHTVATGLASAATAVWTAAQVALNIAMRANPLGIVLTAITALTAGVVIAYKNSDTFRGIVDRLWAAIKTAAGNFGAFVGKLDDFKVPKPLRDLADLLGDIGGGIASAGRKLGGILNTGDGPGIGGIAEGSFKGEPPGVRRLMSLLPAGTRLISGFRPGAITATGNPSYHGKGRAVDLPPSMSLFNDIKRRFQESTKELIFTPAGDRQVNNGRDFRYSGITARNHVDHIHWAMDKGGLARGIGFMPKLTSKPERVLSPAQTAAFERLVSVLDGGKVGLPKDARKYIRAEDGSYVPESFDVIRAEDGSIVPRSFAKTRDRNGVVRAAKLAPRFYKAEDGSFVPEGFYNTPIKEAAKKLAKPLDDFVDYGSVTDVEWKRLKSEGWIDNVSDNAKRIYRPSKDIVHYGTVSNATWQKLIGQGWEDRIADNMKAIYRPIKALDDAARIVQSSGDVGMTGGALAAPQFAPGQQLTPGGRIPFTYGSSDGNVYEGDAAYEAEARDRAASLDYQRDTARGIRDLKEQNERRDRRMLVGG